MNILLTGATGFIGRHLLSALLQAGHQVTACVRDPAKLSNLTHLTDLNSGADSAYCHLSVNQNQSSDQTAHYLDKLTVVTIDFRTACTVEDWLPHLQQIDVVINSAGIIQQSSRQSFATLHTDAPAALFTACAQSAVQRIVHISALGADRTSVTEYHQSKYAADDVLGQMELDWFILRPSIVLGEQGKSLGLFNALAALPRIPVIGNGQQRIQPVVIDDLVEAVLCCVEGRKPARQIIDVVGPSPVTFCRFLQHLRLWQGKQTARLLSIPLPLAFKLLPLAKWLDEPALNKETLHMLEAGNTADARRFTEFIGHPPRSLQQYLATHPLSEAQRWHSQLYFLRPLLRISLALLWIWTGIVSAFLYPQQDSFALLQRVGISAVLLPIMLYGAATLDLLLGMALLVRHHLRLVIYLQIAVIAGYTLVITLALPGYWLHPFGAVSKNIPLLIATVILLKMERS